MVNNSLYPKNVNNVSLVEKHGRPILLTSSVILIAVIIFVLAYAITPQSPYSAIATI